MDFSNNPLIKDDKTQATSQMNEVAPSSNTTPTATIPNESPVMPSPSPVTPNNLPKDQPQSDRPTNPKPRKKILPLLFALLGVVLFVGAGFAAGFYTGSSRERSAASANDAKMAEASMLEIPEGATVTSQCSVGRGTQYVLPKDIPYGPIYNVNAGKVIGIEYMIPKDSLPTIANKFIDYSLLGTKYNHIEIGTIPEGHAGLTMTHYHLDFFNIPKSETSKITCDGAAAEPEMHMDMTSPTPTTAPTSTATPTPVVTATPTPMPTMH